MFKKALVVVKKSVFEKKVLNDKDKKLIQLLKEKHPLTKEIVPSHTQNKKAIEFVKKFLSKLNISHEVTQNPTRELVKKYPLVITVGGDGTLLKASHYVKDEVIFGINSAPSVSVGYLCTATVFNLGEKFKMVQEGSVSPISVNRLKVLINGNEVEFPVLNDVLFAERNPVGTTRYVLKIGKTEEVQKSSGIWISTAAGSTAGINAAGGATLPIESKGMEYLVREPYPFRHRSYRLTRGIVNDKITIISTTFEAGIYIDGKSLQYEVGFGDTIEIATGNTPLKIFHF